MLKEKGSLDEMEVTISKKNTKSKKDSAEGGWYSKGYLEKVGGWNKTNTQSERFDGLPLFFTLKYLHRTVTI